ncbi:Coatomer subunit beta'-2 [Camellia lanceoleosa]|uniref:Coatomer subunit beta'-2 n=1 Tax=Camellia lanceoleosa TaxID=1840588 RepID=A0ACC0IKL4_9ERIC|nr:Coatomer subunit beta'-2 [Camellia lanceoleosa]
MMSHLWQRRRQNCLFSQIWDLGSPTPTFTVGTHSKGDNRADFFMNNDKTYLITGFDDHAAKVILRPDWDPTNSIIAPIWKRFHLLGQLRDRKEISLILLFISVNNSIRYGFDGSEDSKWRFLWADSYGFGGLNLGLQSGFNVEELSSIPNLRSYNYYSDDQYCGLYHKKRANGENFGLSPLINGCDFLGLNLRNKRIVDGENQDLSMGALGYGGGNVDQVKKEP